MTVVFILCISRHYRSLAFPFLPNFFVDKKNFLKNDIFDQLQEIKNELFKTNYIFNKKFKSFLEESTIDLTTITLKEFIKNRYSFAQL